MTKYVLIYVVDYRIPNITRYDGMKEYKCINIGLCETCNLRFRCFTRRGDIFVDYNDIKQDGLEWNFALEKYMHGRILTLTELAVLSEAIYNGGKYNKHYKQDCKEVW